MKLTGTLVGLRQRESKLLDNRTMDRHIFKRGVCLSPKSGLFLGAEGCCFSFPGLLRDQWNEDFHLKAQTTRISKLPAFQVKVPGQEEKSL